MGEGRTEVKTHEGGSVLGSGPKLDPSPPGRHKYKAEHSLKGPAELC